jgi:hypothetical protein
MADFTPVGTQIKPPQGMSLGEMVNMANAIQQYQQSQQMNPVQLESAQTNLGLLKSLAPLQISKATSEAGRSGIEYNVAGETAEPRISQAKSLAETAQTEALKSKYGLNAQYQDDLTKIMGGYANDARLSPDALKKNPANAAEVMHEIKAQAIARGIPTQGLDMATTPGMMTAMQNPTAFPAHLQNMINIGLSASEKRAAGLEKVETTPSGQVIRTTPAIYGNQPKVSFESPSGISPAPSIVEVNGIKYFAGPPKTPGGQPTLQPVPAPSGGAATTGNVAPPAAVTGSKIPEATTRTPLVKEDMPVAKGGLTQMNTQQQTRYEAGQKMFADAATANQNAADQGIILKSIKQNLAQAQSSKPGQLLRQGGKFLAGNEQLDTLLKDLSQNQLLQAKMMGGVDSVNAQNTVAVANGSGDIDPKALAKIVERTDATRLAAQMYNQGLSSYKGKDPYNSAIHADNFQQAWKSNYDPRIFMVENINASDRTPKQKQEDIKRIIGISTPTELQQLKQKAINIRRLQTGDF